MNDLITCYACGQEVSPNDCPIIQRRQEKLVAICKKCSDKGLMVMSCTVPSLPDKVIMGTAEAQIEMHLYHSTYLKMLNATKRIEVVECYQQLIKSLIKIKDYVESFLPIEEEEIPNE